MKRTALIKNLMREIWQSIGRFLAILAIVALGVGLFAGLKVTKEAMVETGDAYFRDNGLHDFRLISTLGLYYEDVEAFKELSFVRDVEGAYSLDVLVEREDASIVVAKMHSLSERINKVELLSGRMPEKSNECLVDSRWYEESQIGETIKITDSNSEDTLDMLKDTQYEIVGICRSSLYVNFERGSTTLGSGRISGFMYVLPETFDCDYYTEVYAITDMSDETIYTDAYKDGIDVEEGEFKAFLEERALLKYTELKTDAQEEIDDAKVKLNDAKDEIAENEQKIADAEHDILEGESKISDGYSKLEDSRDELEAMKAFMPPAMYEASVKELDDAEAELKDKEKEIEDAKADIAEAQVKIDDAKKEVAEHEEELKDAEEKLADLEEPDTYVLTRTANIGYACFENDSAIVEGIGNVFPVFFFLVAALVCMTTMNRMVEEKRTEVGTMKALGYSEAAIMGKYLIYSGSAAIIGCVGGFLLGSWIFPKIIWNVYGIMYSMPDIVYVYDAVLATISVVVSVLCSMGATYYTLNKEFKSNAADLIRPKAPTNGKRVFLEKIGFIWKRLKFTSKVSVRNVFRYRKRFWMMVLGVGGCYGLLITGFGIKDSVADVCDCQFKIIQKYDITVSFDDGVALDDREEFEQEVREHGEFAYAETKTVDVNANGLVKSATLVVFDKSGAGGAIGDYINFMDAKERPIPVPGKGEAIVTEKMAKALDVGIGDKVLLRDPDLNEIEATVSGVMKNYVYNWVYIAPETFAEQRGVEPDYNTAFVKTDVDVYSFGAEIGNLDYVSAVTISDEMSSRIDNMMESLNDIVWVVIFCAAALAFIVIYNLTNINITERLREIATLKVLGFYSGETAMYVFREILVLTGFGIFAGLFMGYGLHRYVMYNVNVEAVTFDTKILPMSYVYGVVLTFLFAFIVDFVLYFKLERIKMAESLKSVE
ncbi:MAG: FtsX-like permease family protein [Lachnospiraceae bacterium]|nr:FtsX-like permease family protein [Lachnospiraceae bacterium]